MQLREMLGAVPVCEWVGDPSADVAAIAYDSRRVERGTLFFCVVGERSDGHEFAAKAVADGATALVCERPLELNVAQAVVADSRAAMAPAAVAFYGDPTASLPIAGITGTNGKTTTAFLVRHLLEATGTSCGLLGTVKRVIGGEESVLERTTPEAIDLQATLARMLAAGDGACAMEVSSHALALGRTRGIRFAVAAFTNLTQDHLDFHADMDEYFAAKARLFAAGETGRPAAAVINLDDPFGARLAAELEPAYGEDLIMFSAAGRGDASLRAHDLAFDASGSSFGCDGVLGRLAVRLPLPGHFNVANALAALAVAARLGVEPEAAAAALATAELVPGRMEPVDEGQRYTVLVDYAHTPDSLDNVLRAARQLTGAKLISVFGCGGDRDRAKRPLMGEIGARLSDLAVVTSDNPRSERPEEIIAEVLAGVPAAAREAGEVLVEAGRREAIARAVAAAGPGDVVVIAGKGHEQGQEFEAGRKVPFDDRQVAREELRRLLARAASA